MLPFKCPGGGSPSIPRLGNRRQGGMHYVHQDGQQVFTFAVPEADEACLKLCWERTGAFKGSDHRRLFMFPHQATLRIKLNATPPARRLRPLRPESVIYIKKRKQKSSYGNTTAGTIPPLKPMNTAV